MYSINEILNIFIEKSKDILREDNLAGIYLHGSACMNCFNPQKSDIDLLVIVYKDLSNIDKRKYMDMVITLNESAPVKGIEMSIIREKYCKPFLYPTPFELHFSNSHKYYYKDNPDEYINNMKGEDKDLAAHIMIVTNRGKSLYGQEISKTFGRVSKEEYFDSIWNDIVDAEKEITNNPAYIIFNLCRVLAYKKKELILSKKEGGEWGRKNCPQKYNELISNALEEYEFNFIVNFDIFKLQDFAKYMLCKISE